MSHVVAIACIFGSAAFGTDHSNDRLVLEIDSLPSTGADATEAAPAQRSSPVPPSIDDALRARGAISLEPVFRKPPRGWRNPEAAAAVGLERFFVARFDPAPVDLTAVARELARLPGVRACRRVAIGELCGTIPDDPNFPEQWALQPGFLDGPAAWDVVTTSPFVVAVIDTGTDLAHPELQASLWTNPGEVPGNGVDDDGNGYVDDLHGYDLVNDDPDPDDVLGHGMFVNGVIGAAGNNGSETAGVCWQVPLMNVKHMHLSRSDLDVVRSAAAVVYAADMGAKVLQMAWGYTDPDPTLYAAILYAVANDAVLVSVPGNLGVNDVVYYPAAWDEALGVIATNENDQRGSFSSYGTWNDLSAPGEDILTISRNGHQRHGQGTTYASAHVSGAAALVRAANPRLDAVDIRLILEQSSRDLGPPGFDEDFGWGRLDLAAAVARARSLVVAANDVVPGGSVSIELSSPGEPGFCHLLLASLAGRRPGTPLSRLDPGDFRLFPLNEDPLLFPFILAWPNDGAGVFVRFVAEFDAAGKDAAVLAIPEGPFFGGSDIDLAWLSFDPADLTRVASTSCSSRVRIR